MPHARPTGSRSRRPSIPADQAAAARRLARAHATAATAAGRLAPGPIGADANLAIVAALHKLSSAYSSLARRGPARGQARVRGRHHGHHPGRHLAPERGLPSCARTATRSAECRGSVPAVDHARSAAARAVDDPARLAVDRRRRAGCGSTPAAAQECSAVDGAGATGAAGAESPRLDRWRARLQRRRGDGTLEGRHRGPRRLNRHRRRQRRGDLRTRARLRRHAEGKRGDECHHCRGGRKQGGAMRQRSSQCGCPLTRCRCRAGSRHRRNGSRPSRCSRSRPSARRGCGRPRSESRGCWSSLLPTPP